MIQVRRDDDSTSQKRFLQYKLMRMILLCPIRKWIFLFAPFDKSTICTRAKKKAPDGWPQKKLIVNIIHVVHVASVWRQQ